jgi:O-antigen/teichoic acid export membrane protein
MLGVSYFVQFATIPYLFRTIGSEKTGLVNLAFSIANTFITITDYGYYISGTKAIADALPNKRIVNHIFNEVTFTKIFLTVLVFPLFVLLVNFGISKNYRDNTLIFYLFYLWVILSQLFPNWLLQGLQDNKFLSLTQSLNRIIQFLLIILLIKSTTPIITIPLIYITSTLAMTTFTYCYIKSKYQIKLQGLISFQVFINRLKNDFNIFISNLLNNIYATSSMFILHYFVPKDTLGWFSICDKLLLGLRQIHTMLFTVLLPKTIELKQKNATGKIDKLIDLASLALGAIYLTIFITLFIFKTNFIFWIFNSSNPEISNVIFISFIVLLVLTLQLKPYLKNLSFTNGNSFKKNYFVGSLFYFIITPTLCYYFRYYGSLFGLIATELMILFLLQFNNPLKNRS